jgi:signal transduction histidine kinase
MKWYLSIFLFLILLTNTSATIIDRSIYLDQNFSSLVPEHIYISEVKDPDINSLDTYTFEKVSNGIKIKGSAVIHQKINFSGHSPIHIIIETGGYHYVDVYLNNDSNDSQTIKRTGHLLGYPENELFEASSRTNNVKFTFEPETIYDLYIFYKNPKNEKIDIKLEIFEEESWKHNLAIKNNSKSFWLGIFFGTLILLSLINFIFYYIFKDGTYIVYVFYILTIAIYEVSLYGYLDQTFFKYFPIGLLLLNNSSLILFIIFYLLFLRSFLHLKETYPRWNTLLNFIIAFLVLIVVFTDILFLLEKPRSGEYYRNISLLLIMPFAIAFLSYVVFSKRLIDRVFFTGSIFLVFSGILSIILYLTGSYQNSDIYLQIGIIIELVIFNIGLGLRSKLFQDEKDRELQKLNISLEEKVEARTTKINEINHELTIQRDQLFDQKEIIEQNLQDLENIRKNLEETVDQKTKELRQANKELVAQNAQLEQYAFITAHNLKAPVARLKGLTNIFEITNTKPNPNEEIVRRIKEASLDMDEVISDINKILQIKNFNQQDKNKIDLPDLIKKIKNRLESKSTQNKVRIETNLQVESILSIDTYLESILYNLIYNGIKYHRDDVDSVVEIQSYKKVKRTIIKVKDNGVGIDLDKYKSKLFGLYQRFHDHVNGKGIGLYLVKTQVEALNGKIYVTSNINEGTEFKLSFPTE